jgi:hypothetical protein
MDGTLVEWYRQGNNKLNVRGEVSASVSLLIKEHTRNGSESTPGMSGERPANNPPSQGTSIHVVLLFGFKDDSDIGKNVKFLLKKFSNHYLSLKEVEKLGHCLHKTVQYL